MGNTFFNEYPYTDFHELNLSWVIKELRSFATTLDQFVSINALKYADPIQWNITSQYEKNTIVIDPLSGTAYISTKPVPVGVILTDTNYWTVVFDLERFVTRANNNFTIRVEESTTLTATFPTNLGEWVVWNGTLYEAQTNILAGDQYVVDSNIKRITIEDVKNKIYQAITDLDTTLSGKIGTLSNLVTTDKSNLVNAVNEVSGHAGTNSTNIGTLSNLVTTDKSNLVNAINEVSGHASTNSATIGDLAQLVTTAKDTLVNAINEVSGHAGTNTTHIGDLTQLNTGIKTDLVSAINEVNANQTTARQLRNRKAILISDSYGVSPSSADNWELKFEQSTGINCLKLAYSGKGFYTNQTNSILQDFSAENIADKDTYTDIIACLGANDICTCIYSDIANLIQAIKDFVNYCKVYYRNAIVHIGCIGYTRYGTTYAGTANVTNYLNVLKAYKDGAGQAGAHYLNGVEMIMHYYPLFSTADWLHPTSAGASKLASGIANAYINGSANISGEGEYFRVTPLTGKINGSSGETLAGLCYIEDENTYYEGSTLNWIYSGTLATLNDSYYDFATINPTSILGNGSPIDISMDAVVISDINAYAGYRTIPIIFRIQSGHIYIRSRYTDGTGAIPTVSCNTIILTLPRFDISTLIN